MTDRSSGKEPQRGHEDSAAYCEVGRTVDMSALDQVALEAGPGAGIDDAMALATTEAMRRLGESMLLSWYDRDRDFESPQHSSECHADSAVPGYVDYGINHGATLRIDVDDGRFVFFFAPVDL